MWRGKMAKRIRKKASVDTSMNFTGCNVQLDYHLLPHQWVIFLQVVTSNVGCHWISNLRRTPGVGGAVEAGTTTTGAGMGCHGTTMAMATVTKTTCQSKSGVRESQVITQHVDITQSHDKLCIRSKHLLSNL